MSNTVVTSINASDRECQARAFAYLVELIGDRPASLTWDSRHHLQGHVNLRINRGCLELVVIAPRDADHEPVVMTAASWEAVRLCSAEQRRPLLASCKITNRAGLASALEADEAPVSRVALGLVA
jgi:hypothetical protein